MSARKYLIVISGPTASGKTSFAIQLAQHFKTEIISADSRQFYQEMNIGTAKPSKVELSVAPHHFIGHLEINQTYSVGDFERDALALLNQLFVKHQVVILTGGSGLYIKALCEGMDHFPEVPDSIKKAIEKLYKEKGINALQEELAQSDPIYYQQVDLQNPHRLIRALSICRATTRPFSEFHNQTKPERAFTPIYLQLHWSRTKLYDRINARVDKMMQDGLLEEARQLFPLKHLNALQTVGYQELFEYIDGNHSLEEAIELIKRNSRRYAKRQLTWSRRNGFWKLIPTNDYALALQYINLAINYDFQIKKFIQPEDAILQRFIQRHPLAQELHWKDKFIGTIKGNELIGLLQFTESKSKIVLSNAVIDPNYQALNLEKLLIHEAHCIAEEKGIKTIIN